jgi:hypothetical protein
VNTFKVAAVREQGIDLVIVPLDRSFGSKSQAQQSETIQVLQRCVTSSGLPGKVVPVWPDSSGRMAFIAPQNWHAFFRNLNLRTVSANINRQITCR